MCFVFKFSSNHHRCNRPRPPTMIAPFASFVLRAMFVFYAVFCSYATIASLMGLSMLELMNIDCLFVILSAIKTSMRK